MLRTSLPIEQQIRSEVGPARVVVTGEGPAQPILVNAFRATRTLKDYSGSRVANDAKPERVIKFYTLFMVVIGIRRRPEWRQNDGRGIVVPPAER